MTKAYNIDCMTAMSKMKDSEFDLAIVDPPYGIDASNDNRFGISTKNAGAKRKQYIKKGWDANTPSLEYFDELKRVSKDQIIWGANYFPLVGGCIFWHKNQTTYSSSSGEIAYKSFGYGVDYISYLWHGAYQENMKNKEIRIHPTQKPVGLYQLLLLHYAKEGDTILDTHLGSGSSRIAAHDMGFDFTGYEIDKDYFDAHEKRFANHIKQQSLFKPNEMY